MTSNAGGDQPHSTEATQRTRLPEHDLLNLLIGKWINEGETIPTDGAHAM